MGRSIVFCPQFLNILFRRSYVNSVIENGREEEMRNREKRGGGYLHRQTECAQGTTVGVMEEEASSALSLSLQVAVVSEAGNEMKVK